MEKVEGCGRPSIGRPQRVDVDQIVAAAAACFAEHGYERTTMTMVAQHVSATKGMVYNHFKSKTDLLLAVYTVAMTRLFAGIDAADKPEQSGALRLESMLRAHAMTMMTDTDFVSVVIQGVQMQRMSGLSDEQRTILSDLNAARQKFEMRFRHAFDAGIEDGSVRRDDASLAVKAMLGAINWMAIWYRQSLDGQGPSREQIAQTLARGQVHGILSRTD
ncbi:TetR family transcriptional regulator [Sagittula sp. NFXS13]|uniref:TetR/AcrR family transcriptional regulator n=1 Tax=Sagittula sp. NFXS13 TaxID=2819095 RepID=UPI0032DF64A8